MAITPKINRYRNKEGGMDSKKVATFFVLILYPVLFFTLYKLEIGIAQAHPKEPVIEIEFSPELVRIPPGVMRRNPEQRPVNNPPIINSPGNSAPQSATVAATNQSTKPKMQEETKPADLSEEGDVEITDTKPKIDERSLFQSTSKGEVEDNTPNNVSENSLYPGVGRETQATRTENTPIGPDHRQPVTANLSGRSVIGSLPLPTYNSQNEGRVVVEITVDQNGNVTKASATGRGSTVQDSKLWRAAEDAAKKAKFNVKKDAPITQIGSITYVFKLN